MPMNYQWAWSVEKYMHTIIITWPKRAPKSGWIIHYVGEWNAHGVVFVKNKSLDASRHLGHYPLHKSRNPYLLWVSDKSQVIRTLDIAIYHGETYLGGVSLYGRVLLGPEHVRAATRGQPWWGQLQVPGGHIYQGVKLLPGNVHRHATIHSVVLGRQN